MMFFAKHFVSSSHLCSDLMLQSNSCLPQITNTLVIAPRANWAIIKLMMILKERAKLTRWFALRRAHEAKAGLDNPSFELLSVALWLNVADYLQQLRAVHALDLIDYLATRQDRDADGLSIWSFVNSGLEKTLLAQARLRRLVPPTNITCTKSKDLTPNLDLHSKDLNLLRLHSTLYCGNPKVINEFLQGSLHKCGRAPFARLAAIGAYQAVLIGIMHGLSEPISVLTIYAQHFGAPNIKALWTQLQALPRTARVPTYNRLDLRDSYSNESTPRYRGMGFNACVQEEQKSLLDTISMASPHPEIVFAYLMFQYMQPPVLAYQSPASKSTKWYQDLRNKVSERTHLHVLEGCDEYYNPKIFYGHCLNIFLHNYLQNPDPVMLELISHAPLAMFEALKPEVAVLLEDRLANLVQTELYGMPPLAL